MLSLLAQSKHRFDDEFDSFRYHVVYFSLLFWVAVSALMLAFPASDLFGNVALAGLLLNLLAFVALQFCSPQRVAFLWLSVTWLAITTSVVTLGGIHNNGIWLYVLILMYSGLLLPRIVTISFAAASSAVCLISVVGVWQGWLPLHGDVPVFSFAYQLERLIYLHAIFIVLAGVLISGKQVLQRNTRLAQQQRRILERHNEQLQHEIERRREVEAALRASASTYRTLFENAGVIALVYNADGVVRLANALAAVHADCSQEEIVGRSLETIFSPEAAAHARARHEQVLASGQSLSYHWQTTLGDGQEYEFRRTIIPLPAPPHKPDDKRLLVLAIDLSAQRKAARWEEDLHEAQERNTFFTEFLGTVSHDLKTPLNVLRTSLYLLERSQDLDKIPQRVERMSENLDLLEHYIQDMLMIARLQSASDLTMQRYDLGKLLKGLITYWQPHAEAKQVELAFVVGDEILPPILADKTQLHRAFTNLIENAINYTPQGGRVKVHLQQHDAKTLLVTIRDTGMGIAKSDLPRIFEQFYRSDSARETLESGTGLGLAIVKSILERHGGRVEVQSVIGAGTTFSVYLPLFLA